MKNPVCVTCGKVQGWDAESCVWIWQCGCAVQAQEQLDRANEKVLAFLEGDRWQKEESPLGLAVAGLSKRIEDGDCTLHIDDNADGTRHVFVEGKAGDCHSLAMGKVSLSGVVAERDNLKGQLSEANTKNFSANVKVASVYSMTKAIESFARTLEEYDENIATVLMRLLGEEW